MEFIHIPKNAGTSIQEAINKPSIGHLGIKKITGLGSCHPAKYEDFFTCVRNPYARACSLFYFSKHTRGCYPIIPPNCMAPKKMGDITMTEFWEEVYPDIENCRLLRKQVDYLQEKDGSGISPKIKYILKHEDLASEWPGFAQKHDFDSLPHRNKSYRPMKNWEWKKEIPRAVIDIVNDFYADDFKHLGYDRL